MFLLLQEKSPEPKDSGRKILPWYHLKFPHMRTLKLCNGSTRQRLLVFQRRSSKATSNRFCAKALTNRFLSGAQETRSLPFLSFVAKFYL